MKITYDASVDAAYIYLTSDGIDAGEVEFTYACDPNVVGGMVHLDFDRNGLLLGIEVLAASKLLPTQLLKAASSDG